jgi:hypothetical protein
MQLYRRMFEIFICLGLAACSRTYEDRTATPLTQIEFDTVISEIARMIKSNEPEVDQFKVVEATPERIEKLLRMPEFKTLEGNFRANALIFASRADHILTFEKPSDVESKVSQWLGSTPNNKAYLWGPFKSSSPQANAFVAFHKCTFPDTWLKPRGSNSESYATESKRLQNREISLTSLVSDTSKRQDWSDFKACLYADIKFAYSYKEADEAAVRSTDVKLIETELIPTLKGILFKHLEKNRCTLSGFDDCLASLHLLISLSPNDLKVASALKDLDADIQKTLSVPMLTKQYAREELVTLADGEDRYRAGLRNAAYLRLRLLSQLTLPSAWPANSLEMTLKQMTSLARIFAEPTAKSLAMDQFRIDTGNVAINPWHSLPKNKPDADAVRQAVLAELETLETTVQCDVFSQWFIGGGKAVERQFIERKIANGVKAWCSNKRPVNTYPEIALAYAKLQGGMAEPDRDQLLSELTSNAENCFDKKILNERKELVPMCSDWISEPETIAAKKLSKGKFRLGAIDEYRSKPLAPPNAKTVAEWETWIKSLMPLEGRWETSKVLAFAEVMTINKVTANAVKVWRSTQSSLEIVEIELLEDAERNWPMNRSRALVVFDKVGPTLVGISSRFAYQYDNGSIFAISDIDRDGNLEIWFKGTDGECDGEDSKPGINCSIESIKMGEIRENAVTYFKDQRSITSEK